MKLETKIKRFERLKEWIREEPRRYNQECWAVRDKNADIVLLQKPPCGTVACLAGGAVISRGYRLISPPFSLGAVYCVRPYTRKYIHIRDAATRILGLGSREADGLFAAAADGWHNEPRTAYFNATGVEGRANAAIAELDLRIAEMRRPLKREGKVAR